MINWKSTYQVQETDALSQEYIILEKHKALFRNELGTITCAKASLCIDLQVHPEFHPT